MKLIDVEPLYEKLMNFNVETTVNTSDTVEGLGITMDEVMQHNVEKLLRRYPNGFESEKSINREE